MKKSSKGCVMRKLLFLSLSICLAAFCFSTTGKSGTNFGYDALSKSGRVSIDPVNNQDDIGNQLITVDENDVAYAIWSIDGKIQVSQRTRTGNWQKAETLSSTGKAKQPAITTSGTTIWAVWSDTIGSSDTSVIRVFQKKQGQPWVQNGYETGSHNLVAPSIASLGNHLFVTYMALVPGNEQIFLLPLINSTSIGAQRISTNSSDINEIPKIAITNTDPSFIDGCVVWSGNTPSGDDQAILSRCFYYAFPSDSFFLVGGAEETVYAQQQTLNFWWQQVILDNNVIPVVVFHDTDHNGGVFAVKRPLQSFNELSTAWVTGGNPVTNFEEAQRPSLTVNTTGNGGNVGDIELVYQSYLNQNARTIMNSTLPQGASSWTTPLQLPGNTGAFSPTPTIAFDASGNVIVVYEDSSLLNNPTLNIQTKLAGTSSWQTLEFLFLGKASSFAFLGLQGQTLNVPPLGIETIFAIMNQDGTTGIFGSLFTKATAGNLLYYNRLNQNSPQFSLVNQ